MALEASNTTNKSKNSSILMRLKSVYTETCDGIKNVETEICLKNCFCHRLKEHLRVCTLVEASFLQGGDYTKQLNGKYSRDFTD